jgi:hypothetical protein
MGSEEVTTTEKFLQFHEENPHVYEGLSNLAKKALARGYETWGIGGMYEVLRWERHFGTTDPEFKLRNDFRAYYARLLIADGVVPEKFFRLRYSQADGVEKLFEKYGDDWGLEDW